MELSLSLFLSLSQCSSFGTGFTINWWLLKRFWFRAIYTHSVGRYTVNNYYRNLFCAGQRAWSIICTWILQFYPCVTLSCWQEQITIQWSCSHCGFDASLGMLLSAEIVPPICHHPRPKGSFVGSCCMAALGWVTPGFSTQRLQEFRKFSRHSKFNHAVLK